MTHEREQAAQEPGFRGRGLRPRDWGIGSTLALLYLVLVMTTTSMGITRDESFYIHYAKVYFNWFTRLARAEDGDARDRLLSREEVKKVWKQNFEHPPLMKVLFGVSWRFLGAKERPADVASDGSVAISGLGLAHGFEVGDRVRLIAPRPLGGDREAATAATVEVNARKTHSAQGRLAGDEDDAETLASLCRAATDHPEDYATGCRVVSSGPLQLLSESDAFRFPGALFGALLVLLLFLFGVELGSTAVGLLAVAFFTFVPRVFFHAHLTCFDIPITALSFAVLYGFFRSLRSTGWAIATAFLWGLALLAKLNAFFLPITLLLWWGIAGIRQFRRVGGRLTFPDFPLAFLLMPVVGLPMLFCCWPWLWYDTVQAMGKYMAFHLHHEHYFQYYFGRAYQSPPFPMDFPYVMTLLTVPLVTLAAFAVGVSRLWLLPVGGWFRGVRAWWRKGDTLTGEWGRGWFVFINLAFPVTLIALPGTPIFGGVKHWMLTMPFFSLLAAHGVLWLLGLAARALGAPFLRLPSPLRVAMGTACCLLLLAPAARDTLRFAPYGTAYFNELIGGVRGAAEARMQRQFWSYASRGALDYVNQVAPADTAVDYQDATRGTCQMQQAEGWMRSDLQCVTRKHAPEILLFDVEERFSEEEMRYWKSMDTVGPVFEAGIDGVPMVRVYRRHAGLVEMEIPGKEE